MVGGSIIQERLKCDVFLNDDNCEKVELISIEKIKYSQNRIRRRINREDINMMAKNLKTFGILQPLEINDKNEVVLGTRRLEAAKLADLKFIPVIRRNSNELYEVEKQIVSDVHSKHLTLLERAEAFKKLIILKDLNKSSLARYLGLSKNLICRTLSILNADKETLELIKKGKISERMVATVLYRLKDKTKEKIIIEKIINEKLNISQAERLISEINDSKILKKHFLTQLKGFKTSLRKFKEKSDLNELDNITKKEIKNELEELRGLF